MIAQKYHKLQDIEPEFIHEIENLLQTQVPNFDALKEDKEKSYDYYLFFTSSTNAPVGFARAEVEFKEVSKGLWPFSKKEKKKVIHWRGIGKSQNAFSFSPKYKNEFSQEAKNIIQANTKEEDILEQKITEHALSFSADSKPRKLQNTKLVDSFFKASSSYEEFINALKTQEKKNSFEAFKLIQNMVFEQKKDLKEIFSYKKELIEEYKLIKNELKNYESSDCLFYTLESKEGLKALITFIKGQKKHYFFKIYNFNESTASNVLLNLLFMAFYEIEDALFLHPLNKTPYHPSYENLGFTYLTETNYEL